MPKALFKQPASAISVHSCPHKWPALVKTTFLNSQGCHLQEFCETTEFLKQQGYWLIFGFHFHDHHPHYHHVHSTRILPDGHRLSGLNQHCHTSQSTVVNLSLWCTNLIQKCPDNCLFQGYPIKITTITIVIMMINNDHANVQFQKISIPMEFPFQRVYDDPPPPPPKPNPSGISRFLKPSSLNPLEVQNPFRLRKLRTHTIEIIFFFIIEATSPTLVQLFNNTCLLVYPFAKTISGKKIEKNSKMVDFYVNKTRTA